MSLENSVTAALTAVNNSITTLNGVGASFQAGAANLTTHYQALLASANTSAVVSQADGSDGNGNGSALAPYKSIQRALDVTPPGGVCSVVLRGDYTVLNADIVVDNRLLILNSEGVTKRLLAVQKSSVAIAGGTLRKIFSFRLRSRGGIVFASVRIGVPVVEGAEAGHLTHDNAAIIKTDDTQGIGCHDIGFINADVVIPSDPFGALIGSITPVPVTLNWQNVAMLGQRVSPLGAIFTGQTNVAGTATSSLSWLSTNLTNV